MNPPRGVLRDGRGLQADPPLPLISPNPIGVRQSPSFEHQHSRAPSLFSAQIATIPRTSQRGSLHMRRFLVLLVVFASFSVSVAQAQSLPSAKPEEVGLSTERLGRIGKVLQAEIQAKKFPGAVAVVPRKARAGAAGLSHAAFPTHQASRAPGREMEALSKAPLSHNPGEVWEYRMPVARLGRVVGAASGTKLSEFLESRLFKPLKMADAAFS